jgi:Lrp/AsnC family leucine-responsive transcriptional regulator
MAAKVLKPCLSHNAPGVRAVRRLCDREKNCHDGRDPCDARAVDPTDRTIVLALQQDARISFRDLAAQANLSPNATAERVRRLERKGILKGYTAIVDPAAAGRTLTALVDLRLKEGTPPEQFEPVIRKLDVVVDCAHVSGKFDYTLRVTVADAAELDQLIRLLKARANVVETDTRLVMRTVVRRATVA